MLIIIGECADDFERLRTDLMAEYDSQSALESELVERLKGILWRLRSVPFFEGAILNTRHVATWAPGYRTSDGTEGEADENQEEFGLEGVRPLWLSASRSENWGGTRPC